MAAARKGCDAAHVHAATDPFEQRMHRWQQSAATKRARGYALIDEADKLEAKIAEAHRMKETGYGPTHPLG